MPKNVRTRKWWRDHFHDHPLADAKNPEAFSGSGASAKPKIYCIPCYERGLSDARNRDEAEVAAGRRQSTRDIQEISDELWAAEQCGRARGWSRCAKPTLLNHLRDCELQPKEVRDRARWELRGRSPGATSASSARLRDSIEVRPSQARDPRPSSSACAAAQNYPPTVSSVVGAELSAPHTGSVAVLDTPNPPSPQFVHPLLTGTVHPSPPLPSLTPQDTSADSSSEDSEESFWSRSSYPDADISGPESPNPPSHIRPPSLHARSQRLAGEGSYEEQPEGLPHAASLIWLKVFDADGMALGGWLAPTQPFPF